MMIQNRFLRFFLFVRSNEGNNFYVQLIYMDFMCKCRYIIFEFPWESDIHNTNSFFPYFLHKKDDEANKTFLRHFWLASKMKIYRCTDIYQLVVRGSQANEKKSISNWISYSVDVESQKSASFVALKRANSLFARNIGWVAKNSGSRKQFKLKSLPHRSWCHNSPISLAFSFTTAVFRLNHGFINTSADAVHVHHAQSLSFGVFINYYQFSFIKAKNCR